ncbi:hypothetical protein THAOC_12441 [Thalassiosira oceanica]|uniref:Uncharacterized protein n=1 Tax=Thalassiosira oceanica TaxID=159749 RepID=K0SK35_THAOC|nr:hypothetical protein THAOC_12441 [Thalassiosira oceanica]|eukprot:EJK66628.1 hypothetical protein THAOC_12441 [Thalassiosira oceanica]
MSPHNSLACELLAWPNDYGQCWHDKVQQGQWRNTTNTRGHLNYHRSTPMSLYCESQRGSYPIGVEVIQAGEKANVFSGGGRVPQGPVSGGNGKLLLHLTGSCNDTLKELIKIQSRHSTAGAARRITISNRTARPPAPLA